MLFLTQVLQGNGVTVSFITPSIIGLDKTLESIVTNYTHFNKALRTGIHTHFQSLIHQKDMILAAVLDPRIKLQVLNLNIALLSCVALLHPRVESESELSSLFECFFAAVS